MTNYDIPDFIREDPELNSGFGHNWWNEVSALPKAVTVYLDGGQYPTDNKIMLASWLDRGGHIVPAPAE